MKQKNKHPRLLDDIVLLRDADIITKNEAIKMLGRHQKADTEFPNLFGSNSIMKLGKSESYDYTIIHLNEGYVFAGRTYDADRFLSWWFDRQR